MSMCHRCGKEYDYDIGRVEIREESNVDEIARFGAASRFFSMIYNICWPCRRLFRIAIDEFMSKGGD